MISLQLFLSLLFLVFVAGVILGAVLGRWERKREPVAIFDPASGETGESMEALDWRRAM